MTLIDTRPGIAAVWDALSPEPGVAIASAAGVPRLGPPLDEELAVWFPEADRPAAGDRFRALYPSLAVEPVPVLAGAREAVAAGPPARGPRLGGPREEQPEPPPPPRDPGTRRRPRGGLAGGPRQ